MERVYRQTLYKCGEYMDAQVYPVYKRPGQRAKRAKPTSEVQQRLNEYNAMQCFLRLLHLNFTNKDLELHLTYNEGAYPQSYEEALKDSQNYKRRIKKYYKEKGIDVKILWIIAKGDSSERIHHHVTITGGVDRDILESEWKKGFANTKRLKFGKDGLKGLAYYMTKQKHAGFRKWNATKNMIKPSAREKNNVISNLKMKEMQKDLNEMGQALFIDKYSDVLDRMYPGHEISDIQIIENGFNHGYYMKVFGRAKKEESILYKKEYRY